MSTIDDASRPGKSSDRAEGGLAMQGEDLRENRNAQVHEHGLSVLAYARLYLKRNYQPVPVLNGKNPGFDKWQKFTCTPADVARHFTATVNIGLLNGTPSNGLVDVDLDTEQAVAVAGSFLSETGMIGGHDRRPRSHHFFQLTDEGETKQFKYLLGKEEITVVELRSTGTQTVVPPSRHPDGGVYHWDQCGEPARVPYADL